MFLYNNCFTNLTVTMPLWLPSVFALRTPYTARSPRRIARSFSVATPPMDMATMSKLVNELKAILHRVPQAKTTQQTNTFSLTDRLDKDPHRYRFYNEDNEINF
jgi:hypothetical protein